MTGEGGEIHRSHGVHVALRTILWCRFSPSRDWTHSVFCQLSFLHIPDLSSGPISLSTAPYTSCRVCGAEVIMLP